MNAARTLTLAATLLAMATPTLAGNPEAGRQKATACIACHGDANFPGLFYTLQLAGRNADKLAIKTNKYRTGKIHSPIMAAFTIPLKEEDIADISAWYQSLGKPALMLPFSMIKGDDEVQTGPVSATPTGSAYAAR